MNKIGYTADNSSKKKQTIIVNQIEIKPVNRQILDIGKWRTALQSADMGRRTALFNMYEDILTDGVLGDAIDKRIRAVTGAELTFQYADGSESEDMIKLIDTEDFEYLLQEVIKAKFWHMSVIEPMFNANGISVYSVPRKHIRLETKTIAKMENDPEGQISYDGLDVIEVISREHQHGLLLRACPYAIMKRGGIGDWAQMVELFGMPQRIGKYSIYDTEARKALQEAFNSQGAAATLIVPKETDIDTTTQTGNGGGTLYKDFINTLDEQLLITTLSQTMTTKDGASRSQGQVHKEVEEEVNKSDLRFVQRVLNHKLKPILEKRGYPVKGGSFVFPKAIKDLTVEELIKLSDIIEIPAYYFQEKFGIPAADKDDVIARGNNKQEPDPQPVRDEQEAKKTKRKLSDRFFVDAPTQERGEFGYPHMILSDDTNFNERIISRINGKEKFDIELFEFTVDKLREAVNEKIKMDDSAFVYGEMDDAYKTAMEINLFHFSAAKTIAEISELNRLFREATSFEEFYREALKVTDIFNRRWMETEYQTALLVAESASNYWRLKKKVDIFPYWQYTAVMDGRTRESHANLHGVILPANDARWKKIMPPNGWKCRCRIKGLMRHELPEDYNFDDARALVDEYLETDEWKSVAAQGWDTNRAETAEIFTKNQQYINKFPQQGGRFLDDMTSQKWGLDTVSGLKKKATGKMPETELSASEIWDRYAKDEQIKIKLFNDRQLTLTKKNFDAHTVGKSDNRAKFWDALLETLEKPDELWLNNELKIDRDTFRRWIIGNKKDKEIEKLLNYDNFNAIRYYNDEAIIANYRITNGTLELKTWYSLRLKKSVTDRYRRGLFIKQKKSSD